MTKSRQGLVFRMCFPAFIRGIPHRGFWLLVDRGRQGPTSEFNTLPTVILENLHSGCSMQRSEAAKQSLIPDYCGFLDGGVQWQRWTPFFLLSRESASSRNSGCRNLLSKSFLGKLLRGRGSANSF